MSLLWIHVEGNKENQEKRKERGVQGSPRTELLLEWWNGIHGGLKNPCLRD